MFTESETQNYKKIFLEEVACYCQNGIAEKTFDEMIEKIRSKDLSERDDLDTFCEKLGMGPELQVFFKENFECDPFLSGEENFRNGTCLGKEYMCIEQKNN